MKALYLTKNFKNADDIHLTVTDRPKPTITTSECLIRVASSGVNPSDAIATLGYFQHAQLPRIPGRDFSGTVVDGDVDLIGKQVWGSGGAAGIDFDGTHAEYIVISNRACAEIPKTMDLLTAGAQPLPYITAYYSLVTRARIKTQETIVVVGALGQVGSAAMAISQWKNCNVIAIVKGEADLQKAKANFGWQAVDSDNENFINEITKLNGNKPVNVILNSLGNLFWDKFISILAPFGRIVTISAREGQRDANINLFELYRNNQDLIHINTVALNYTNNSYLLNELRPGFESGKLQPLEVTPESTFSLKNASEAYQIVGKGGASRRIVLNLAEE